MEKNLKNLYWGGGDDIVEVLWIHYFLIYTTPSQNII